MLRPATRALIERSHRHGAFYRDYLANHLPMALGALDAMGADDAAIARFARAYERQLEPIGAARHAIGPGDEAAYLGDPSAFPAWVDYFADRLAREGVAAVLESWNARLAEGIGTAAFHGAIRTAYAMESGIEHEIAHALAYWAAAFKGLECQASPGGVESPLEVLAAISRDSRYAGRRPAGTGIAGRMAAVSREPSFAPYVARLAPSVLELDAFAPALIRAYAASGDFTLLHGVTGCQAFRVLAPHFETPGEALRHLWIAIVAAYMACGSPPVEGWGLRGNDDLPWTEIHFKAAACDDEHDVKFAYSCWREWQASRDDLYRRAASARVCHALEEAVR